MNRSSTLALRFKQMDATQTKSTFYKGQALGLFGSLNNTTRKNGQTERISKLPQKETTNKERERTKTPRLHAQRNNPRPCPDQDKEQKAQNNQRRAAQMNQIEHNSNKNHRMGQAQIELTLLVFLYNLTPKNNTFDSQNRNQNRHRPSIFFQTNHASYLILRINDQPMINQNKPTMTRSK